MALLEVENVRRSFGGMVAVDGVSFEVARGGVKAIIGPNGAGKTTLFNLISGLLHSETGQVVFAGRRIDGLRPHRIARAGLSRTFQTPSLFLQMSVLENVMVGRHCRTRAGFAGCALRLPGQQKEERAIRESALHWLEFVGLADHAERAASSLSFGRRRMVELARAVATEPSLLLLDEPASGLNTRETFGLAELIGRIRGQGTTVLLIEHDMSLVMDISDDILVLHNGRRIAEGPPAAIQDNAQVVAVYLGSEYRHAAASEES